MRSTPRASAKPRKHARKGLTPKERLFCEAYAGAANGVGKTAAELAGYKGTDGSIRVKASVLLSKPHIQAELERLRASVTTKAAATREERQEFLTRMMRNEKASTKDRIKACEVLGRMQGDFIEKREHSINGAAQVLLYVPNNGRGRD